MKLGQKIRTIARKASLKVSVATTEQSVSISLVKGDLPTFLDTCMKKYPKGLMSQDGKIFTFGLGDAWPTATKPEPKAKIEKAVKEVKAGKPADKPALKVKKGDHSKAVDTLVGNFNPVIPKELKKKGHEFHHELTDHTTKTVIYFEQTPHFLPENLKASYNKFEADLSKFIISLERLGYKYDSHA